jgi:hypothetical protein
MRAAPRRSYIRTPTTEGSVMRTKLHSVAAACCLVLASQVQADIAVGGSWGTNPGGLAIGPGDTDIGSAGLSVGNAAAGSFAATAGSRFSGGLLSLGTGGSGSATALIDGLGTAVSLVGNGDVNRLDVGSWGIASATVSGGALLDGRANAAACLLGARSCNNFIGNAAGSDATFTVTGAGSRAEFLHGFIVGGLAVFRPPTDSFTFGTPGSATTGRVNVLAGGALLTESASIAQGPGGSSPAGTERSFGSVVVDGSNSVWRVTGGSVADPRAAFVTVANHANAWGTLTVSNGGRLQFDATPNFVNGINLTENNGRSDTLVSGSGSGMDINGGVLQVGRRLGTATMTVNAGATVNDVYYLSVGRDGAIGSMTVDGAGSAVTINRAGPANTSDAAFQGGLHVGRNGTGTLTVSNGARIDVTSTTAANRARYVELGVGAASSGTLNISGPGSLLRVSVDSLVAGGGPNETLGPYAGVGAQGAGTLNIEAGGRLVLEGSYVSTEADRRGSVVAIGGGSDTTAGARGIAVVRGAGSEISVNGAERFIVVGRGPGSFGDLTLADGGKVLSTNMNVGRAGAVGVLAMNAGRVELSGQYSNAAVAQNATGLGIGIGGATGVVRMDNGSTISLVNPGSAGMGVSLGGSFLSPGGDGSLTMSGGSSITIVTAPGQSGFTVGRDGSGLLRMSGASSIDIGSGNLYVARLAGSDGTLIATGGSTLAAGWVGVGRNRLAGGGDADGGTGTLVLNGATLNAQDVVIGTNGFLGGTAGSVNVSGSVVNYGIFSPGNSPGRFTINGNYVAGAGSRLILEVQSDGQGGFVTDEVIFGEASTLELGPLAIEFRFLGATDPNAFQASGRFDIDTFIARQTSGGGRIDVDHALFAATSFSARADVYTISNFAFSADGGASFVAVAVPEPEGWLLMLAGFAAVAGVVRRRSRR